jgi:hypothetical protein
MTNPTRKQLLEKIEQLLARPGGRQAVRYVLNLLGSIPVAGGAIAGAGALWAEKEQGALNQEILNWASLADSQLNELVQRFEELSAKPTPASMALLISEILGRTPVENEPIPVVLNPATIEELQPYIKNGWVTLQSTGATSSMGSGNRVGNHFEELKRPYGLGNGFVLIVTSWDPPTQ